MPRRIRLSNKGGGSKFLTALTSIRFGLVAHVFVLLYRDSLRGCWEIWNEHFPHVTPKAIQDLLDELEASKQSRLRAWNVLQRLRFVLSEAGNVAIAPPAQKTFNTEGETPESAIFAATES
jgi:hypothetical protein